ncbi:MAG TPA: sigma-70 family RNA polymerase sigma factor [Flavobacteriia bacterium]|nr:sigma-70 family RNA polymerase sigma factor [Flavobacteriia bacterium]
MDTKIEILVAKATTGDKNALTSIVVQIKELVYNVSLKMLLFPEDAQDATQEILIKIITHLSTFKGNSSFKTWVYRVASNYLITIKGKKSKEFAMDFNEYADFIDTGISNTVAYTENLGELLLLEEEVKVSCTHGLLLCLNESGRMVYILGEILEFNSIEGAEILNISPENFRKQLSRSRKKIRNFLQSKCGLANPKNPCRCTKKIDFLIDNKAIHPKKLRFANVTNRSIDLMDTIKNIEKSVAIFRSVPTINTPNEVIKKTKEIINIS